jgi:tRNA(His) guanylyltransferase
MIDTVTNLQPMVKIDVDSIDQEIDQKTMNELDKRMKSYEKTDTIPPYQSFIVRANGDCFSRYTSNFIKPFDIGFSRAMIKTANVMMNVFNAKTVFVCSDEITLIFSPICTKEYYDSLINDHLNTLPSHIHAGLHDKLTSLVSSKCSVLFKNCQQQKTYNERAISTVKNIAAIFDARVIPFPLGNEIEIVNNIIWRQFHVCYRNTVYAYGRYILGDKACVGKNCRTIIQTMKDEGFDFHTQVSNQYKYGVLCKKILVKIKTDNGEEYERFRDYNFCTKLITQDGTKILELFFEKYYCDLIENTKID